MVDAVNRAGGTTKLTVCGGRSHDSWTPVYESTEVFSWLLENTNKNSPAERTNYQNSEKYG